LPWSKGEMPPRLRGKGIPQQYVNLFITVYDAAYKEYTDEGKAYQTAYAALRKAMEKAGYSKNKESGVWSKGESMDMDIDTELSRGLLEPIVVAEEVAADGGLRFRGVALVDEAISGNTGHRYYSKAFNDKCMEATNQYMADGHIVTIYSRHGKAIPKQGQLPEHMPVGRVTKDLWREGRNVMYEGFIAPTAEGRDLATLIRSGVVKATSIRAIEMDSRKRKMGDQTVEEMLEGVIVGIDTADFPGIAGAGITELLEETPKFSDEEVNDMEWGELTLEELVANRQDLLDEHVASVTEVLNQKVQDLEAQLVEAQKVTTEDLVPLADKTALEVKVAEMLAELSTLRLEVAIEYAAQIGVGRKIVEELKSKVKIIEDIDKMLPNARSRALALVLSGVAPSPVTAARGVVHEEQVEVNEDGTVDDDELTEEQRDIMRIAG
jgi:hypothetical protein